MGGWTPGPGTAGQAVTGSVVFGDVVQISSVSGNVVVSPDRPPYRVVVADDQPVPLDVERARNQPSRLLLAQHQVVPFTGRDHTLDRLAAWTNGEAPVAALLMHAAGGQGKTRLAARVGALCARAGWTVWQAAHHPLSADGSAVSRRDLPGAAVLTTVDYADRWPLSALLTLLAQLRAVQQRTGARMRILLLARSDGYWWPALADRAESELHIEVDQMALPSLAEDGGNDRTGMFSAAVDRFADALDLPIPGPLPAPNLSGDGYAQVLAVHMAALVAVEAYRHCDTVPSDPGAVSAYLLRREQAYWQHLHARTETPLLTPPEVMHRAVLTATLTGAQPRRHARQALVSTRFAGSTEGADRIIDDHAVCYPPTDIRAVFEPLHPDRLGEDLIALSAPGLHHGSRLARDWTPEAIIDLLTGTPAPAWGGSAMTVLVEAARRWPHLATDVLYPLVREHPQVALAAGGATVTRLAGIPGIDPTVLEALEPLLPAERHIDLDIAAAAIVSTLTTHRLARTTDPVARARLYAAHSRRLANAGRREEALASAEEAVTIRRRLAESAPDPDLPDLAAMLSNISTLQADMGRWEGALLRAEESTIIHRRLAAADPDAHLPALAASLNNLSALLARWGRMEEALAPLEEAVSSRRRLAGADPDTHLPVLAMSLTNLGNVLAAMGRLPAALGSAQEGAHIYRRLAAADPNAYLPAFAASLNNLGNVLSALGRPEEALAPTEEGTFVYRRLAAANPDAYLSDLAKSLSNVGNHLWAMGRPEAASAVAEESVGIYRELAGNEPDAYLPELARSLIVASACQWESGHRARAMETARESVAIWRRLAVADRDGDLYHLAAAVNNLGAFHAQLGEPEQALALGEEAVRLYRRLVDAEPGSYLPDLADALHNLVNIHREAGRGEPAVASAAEAVDLYRRLAEHLPNVFSGRLLGSLLLYADVLDGLGRTGEAAEARREATGGRATP